MVGIGIVGIWAAIALYYSRRVGPARSGVWRLFVAGVFAALIGLSVLRFFRPPHSLHVTYYVFGAFEYLSLIAGLYIVGVLVWRLIYRLAAAPPDRLARATFWVWHIGVGLTILPFALIQIVGPSVAWTPPIWFGMFNALPIWGAGLAVIAASATCLTLSWTVTRYFAGAR